MKHGFAVIISALLLAFPSSAVAADYAASLQAVHRSAVGFSFDDGTLKAWRATETAADPKDPAQTYVTQWRHIGLLYRADERDVKANNQSSNGFTGNVFWYSDENGFTVRSLGNSVKTAFTDQLIFDDAIATLPWTFVRADSVSGTAVSVVHVAPEHAFGVDAYIDAKTGLYKRFVIDPGGDYERSIDVLGYGEVAPGKRLISKWKYSDAAGVHVLSDLASDDAMDPNTLHPPAPSASWTFGTGAPVPIHVKNSRIVVNATVNGTHGVFMLDTGAGNIVLSGSFARRAGLKAIGHSEIGGPDVDEKVDYGRADTITIGDSTLHDANVYFGTQELDDTAPDGELGFDFLAGADVTVDFKHSTIAVADPDVTNASMESGIHIVTDLGTGSPVVPFKLGDTVELNAIVDTGAPGGMLIPDGIVEKYGLHLYDQHGDCGELDNLVFGRLTVRRPRACMGDIGGRDAIIGYYFLQSFDRIQFDYPHNELILIQSPAH